MLKALVEILEDFNIHGYKNADGIDGNISERFPAFIGFPIADKEDSVLFLPAMQAQRLLEFWQNFDLIGIPRNCSIIDTLINRTDIPVLIEDILCVNLVKITPEIVVLEPFFK